MDNQLIVHNGSSDDSQTFYDLTKLVEHIKHRIAHWNIDSGEDIVFTVRKVPAPGETLGIVTGEDIATEDKVL